MLKHRSNQTSPSSLTALNTAERTSIVSRILAVCIVAIALFSVFLINKAGAESDSSPNVIASTLAPNVTFQDPNIDLAVQDIALQPDGKILIGGNFANVGGQPRKKVARLNSDGSLDPSFVDPNVTSTTANDTVFAIARQSSGGAVLIGGLFDTVAGVPRRGIALLNEDGTLVSGWVPNLNGSVLDVAYLPDGSMLAGGYFTTADGQPRTRLVRLTGTGTLHSDFQNPNIDGAVRVIAFQSDGKIIIGGEFQNVGGQPHQHIARLNLNGTVDSTFNVNIDHFVNDIVFAPATGSIMVGGEFNTVNGQSRSRLIRLDSNGTIDPDFQPPAFSPAASIEAVRWQSDKILIGGTFSSVGGVARKDIARLNSNGTLDTSFRDVGMSGSFGGVNAITTQADQKILLGGDFQDFGIHVFKKVVRVLNSGFLELPPFLQLMVTKTADTNDGVCDADCSLREAIAVANATNNESVITFDPQLFGSPQTIVLTNGELVITNSREMQIAGTGPNLLTISGNNLSRVLRLGNGAKAYVSNLTIANGNGVGAVNSGTGGGIYLGADSSFILALAVLSNNTASQAGGIGHLGRVTIYIGSSTFTGNSSTTNNPSAGAIYLDNGTLEMGDVTLSNNSANNSSGGAIHIGSSFASLDMSFCYVTGNTAKFAGGIYNSGTSTISNSTIINNQSLESSGGGIYNENGTMTLSTATVDNNTAALGSGGGIFNFGSLTINGGNVRNNSALSGGGISTSGGLTLTGTTISGNTASSTGAGIQNNSGGSFGLPTTTITNAIITENNALNSFGGGIYNRDILGVTGTTISNNYSKIGGGGIFYVFLNGIPANLTVSNSTISGNRSDSAGGGMQNQSGTATLTNTTVSGNSAAGLGGGILLSSAATLNLSNTTIAYNRAITRAGGVRNNASTVNARNTIIARNGKGDPSVMSDFDGTLESQGYNLIGTTVDTVINGTTTGNLLNIDPLLAPLGSYGGATKTHPLRLHSPAIDAGGVATPVSSTDQRGKPRPFDFPSIPNASGGDGSDIGSYERQATDQVAFRPALFDFDGDGRSDVSVFRPSDGTWYVSGSLAGFSAQIFGNATDKLTPADFDGDGKTDTAIFRDGDWYINGSRSGFATVEFGQVGDIPIPGDWDGDTVADVAVFRPASGNFYVLQSSNGAYAGRQWGADGDIPLIGDYDGNLRIDYAVYRPSTNTFYVAASGTDAFSSALFGTSGDKPIAADFDGDRRTDFAVYRPSTGTWYYLQSSDGGFRSVAFGTSGDIPAAADYDGDGKWDVAVFRPSDGTFYILLSTTGGVRSQQFGSASDVPVAGAFVP
jgi:uncharacterized delta-60 repeat protein/CSLREA domain-containing protein